LSATVSWILIFQSRTRESTISKHATTWSVAARTCASVTPGPIRSRARTNAISPSALAWIIAVERGTSPPSAWCAIIMRSVR
jgi:hypothetical protein